jgi:hypothetical protein
VCHSKAWLSQVRQLCQCAPAGRECALQLVVARHPAGSKQSQPVGPHSRQQSQQQVAPQRLHVMQHQDMAWPQPMNLGYKQLNKPHSEEEMSGRAQGPGRGAEHLHDLHVDHSFPGRRQGACELVGAEAPTRGRGDGVRSRWTCQQLGMPGVAGGSSTQRTPRPLAMSAAVLTKAAPDDVRDVGSLNILMQRAICLRQQQHSQKALCLEGGGRLQG